MAQFSPAGAGRPGMRAGGAAGLSGSSGSIDAAPGAGRNFPRMTTPKLPLAARIRHYLTLIVQSIPLTFMAVALANGLTPLRLAVTLFFLLAVLGPVAELMGRSLGRKLTLATLAIETGAFGFALVVLLREDGIESSDDVTTVALLLVPAVFLIWNLLGGRKRPAPTGA